MDGLKITLFLFCFSRISQQIFTFGINNKHNLKKTNVSLKRRIFIFLVYLEGFLFYFLFTFKKLKVILNIFFLQNPMN